MCVPIYKVSAKCRLAANHSFHHANENVTTIITPKMLFILSVCSLHFVLSTNLYIKDKQDMNIFLFC